MSEDYDDLGDFTGLHLSSSERPSSSGSSVILASPGSDITGGVGSVDGSVQGKKRFSTFLVTHLSDLCCGAVKSQGSIRGCVKSKVSCEVAQHRSTKVHLEEGMVYLLVSKNFVTLEVAIPLIEVPETERDALLTGKFLVEEFSVMAENITMDERISTYEKEEEEATSKSAAAQVARASEFMTPAKKKLRKAVSFPFFNGDNIPLPTVKDWTLGTREERQNAVNRMLKAWPEVVAHLRELGDWAEILPMEVDAALSDSIEPVAAAILEVSTQVRLLKASLGRRTYERFPEATGVWEALEYLRTDLGRVSDHIAATEEVDPRKELLDKIYKVDLARKKMVEWLKSEQKYYTSQFSTHQRSLDTLELRMHQMEGATTGEELQSSGRKRDVSGARKDSLSREDDNPHEGPNMEDILHRLSRVERCDSGGGCFVGRQEFQSESDVVKFLTDNQVTGSNGIFWDLSTLLICMEMSTGSTGKDRSDSSYSAKRAGEMSALEANYLASFGHRRPNLFFGRDELKGEDSVLTISSSFAGWSDGGEYSVEHKVTLKFDKFVRSVRQNINRENVSDLAQDTGGKMLDEAINQWEQLKSFMTRMHKELITVANFRPEAAWRLLGKTLGGIFQYLDEDRSQASLIETTKRVGDRAAVNWLSLRAHQKMKNLVSMQFKTHPVVVKELSLFMLTERVDPSVVTGLQADLRKAKDAAAASEKAALAASEEVALAQGKIKTLEGDFKSLQNEWKQFKQNKKP